MYYEWQFISKGYRYVIPIRTEITFYHSDYPGELRLGRIVKEVMGSEIKNPPGPWQMWLPFDWGTSEVIEF